MTGQVGSGRWYQWYPWYHHPSLPRSYQLRICNRCFCSLDGRANRLLGGHIPTFKNISGHVRES